MAQEKMLLKLQELVQEEFILKRKEELLPVIQKLKEMQETIKGVEEEARRIEQQINEEQSEAAQLEKHLNSMANQVKNWKEKLYNSKGGSLKELLSLQQSILKTEEEAEKGENVYYEKLKKVEEMTGTLSKTKEIVKELKKNYNQEVKGYKERLNEVELKLADNLLKQEKLKEDLSPEALRLFMETKRKYPQNPVAVMKGGSCSGCHISVPAMLVSRVREGRELNLCDSCGRILIRAVT